MLVLSVLFLEGCREKAAASATLGTKDVCRHRSQMEDMCAHSTTSPLRKSGFPLNRRYMNSDNTFLKINFLTIEVLICLKLEWYKSNKTEEHFVYWQICYLSETEKHAFLCLPQLLSTVIYSDIVRLIKESDLCHKRKQMLLTLLPERDSLIQEYQGFVSWVRAFILQFSPSLIHTSAH